MRGGGQASILALPLGPQRKRVRRRLTGRGLPFNTGMLIALLADIHANREALTACLVEAERAGADRYVFLGDLVGYGADPCWVLDRVAEMVESGAVAVLGNHDAAAIHGSETMTEVAGAAIAWTRTRLGEAHRSFLSNLPLGSRRRSALCPRERQRARRLDLRFRPPRGFSELSGNSPSSDVLRPHARPRLFNETATTLPQRHVPVDGRPIPLLPQRRWLAVLGAVGQPRDNNPAACFGLFDEGRTG